MELIKKLIFSTKESLKWGFILGCALILIPFLAFAVSSNEIFVNITYDESRFWVSSGMPENYHIGFIANQYFDNWSGNYGGWPQPGSFGNTAFENGASASSSIPIYQGWFYWNAFGFNETGMWIYVGEEMGYNEILGYYGDYFYIPPDAETERELRVFGISPASGSTATSTNENFIVGWEGWDFEFIYKDFVFSFYEKNTGILTGSEIYEPETENGTTTLKFSDFKIDKNGKYYFYAKARSYLYEYTAYYTGDLVLPEWWVNIQVEGWPAIFEMPTFETWYNEHSKFATSTAIFSGVAGLLSPRKSVV